MNAKLSIQYPLAHKDVFEPLCDFNVWDMSQGRFVTSLPGSNLPYWLDYSKREDLFVHLPKEWDDNAEAIILPTNYYPDPNVLMIAKYADSVGFSVGVWCGERRHIALIQTACDLVAIPNTEPRRVYITPADASLYHFYEFCNLDELRTHRPRSLHTSTPITSAIMGIDLRARERRCRKLPTFNYDIKLNNSQLELAVENVNAIREALT